MKNGVLTIFTSIFSLCRLQITLAGTQNRQKKKYKLADSRNLTLIVHPNGSKYWVGAYRFDGKQRSLHLGIYPDIKILEARELWEAARKQLKEGIDPNAAKQATKRKRLEDTKQTFEVIAREWHSVKLNSWKANTARDNIHRLETDIFPELGSVPISTITPQQVLSTLRRIENRGALEVASRTRGICARVFDYAIACGHCSINPAAPLKDVLKTPIKGNFAAIEVEEFPVFVKMLVKASRRMFLATHVALWLMMRTFVRTGELIAAPWREFDLEKAIWLIPAKRMKKARDHIVPLSRQAISLLKEMQPLTGKNEYVFP